MVIIFKQDAIAAQNKIGKFYCQISESSLCPNSVSRDQDHSLDIVLNSKHVTIFWLTARYFATLFKVIHVSYVGRLCSSKVLDDDFVLKGVINAHFIVLSFAGKDHLAVKKLFNFMLANPSFILVYRESRILFL